MAEANKQEFDPSEAADDAARDSVPGPEAPDGGADDGAAPDAHVAQLTAERDEMRDRLMRALAEAENTRKRAERDRREAERYGGARLARDLLPVHDNLQRALMAVTDDQRDHAAALIEGVELTLKELHAVFKRHDLTIVRPAVGDRFDPQMHQAMFEAAVPDTRAGEIIQVMADGFVLNDRLLRPAQVGVSSTPG